MNTSFSIAFDAKRAATGFTGLGNYSRYVLGGLCKYSDIGRMLCYTPNQITNSEMLAIMNESQGRIIPKMPESSFWKLAKSAWRTLGITSDLMRSNISLYHGLSNELPLNISKKGIKTVVTIHDIIFRRLPECYHLIDRKIYDYKFRKACEIADIVVAVSECAKRDIISDYGIPEEKIRVIYQGCDPQFAIPATDEKKSQVRRKYNLPDRYILNLGSIERRKNAALIVRALRFIDPAEHLVIVGKRTPYTAEVEKIADELGVGERLHIYSGVPFADLPSFYQMSDLFVYPSFYEGFGIPILEALWSSVPVIAATGSCLEEAGGKHSIYINPNNPDELAEKITAVLTDDNLRQTMIENGRTYAQTFTQEVHTAQMLTVYQEALNK